MGNNTHWEGALLGSNRAMGGAAEEMDNLALAGESDMITVFDDFNHVMTALTFGAIATGDANTNCWEDCGWVLTDVGAPNADYISMNDPVGGQLPFDSCIALATGDTEDTGGNCQLDLINTPLIASIANTFTAMATLHYFPHIWIDETGAGVTALDSTTLMFACRIGLRADTDAAGAGAWDSKCFVGWSVAGEAEIMTPATGVLKVAAADDILAGFHIPEAGAIHGISQRVGTTAYVEGTNFTAIQPAGAVAGTVANGLETAGDTCWWDLALRMDIRDWSETVGNGFTTFYSRKVVQNASVTPGSSSGQRNPWKKHSTVLIDQIPVHSVALVPTIEVQNGGTVDVDGEVYLDWWAFGKSRTSRLSK